MANTAIVWIRDDFRIQNNDALTYASNNHDIVTAVFIFNSSIFDHKREAQKWWISKSLENFRSDLKKLNIGLEIIKDDEISFFSKIKSNNKISVYWNKVYEPTELEKDKKIGTNFSWAFCSEGSQYFSNFLYQSDLGKISSDFIWFLNNVFIFLHFLTLLILSGSLSK